MHALGLVCILVADMHTFLKYQASIKRWIWLQELWLISKIIFFPPFNSIWFVNYLSLKFSSSTPLRSIVDPTAQKNILYKWSSEDIYIYDLCLHNINSAIHNNYMSLYKKTRINKIIFHNILYDYYVIRSRRENFLKIVLQGRQLHTQKWLFISINPYILGCLLFLFWKIFCFFS